MSLCHLCHFAMSLMSLMQVRGYDRVKMSDVTRVILIACHLQYDMLVRPTCHTAYTYN